MSPPQPPPPEIVLRNRFLGFLIWQSITSTLIFIFFKPLIKPSSDNIPSFLSSVFTFLLFQISQSLFSVSLYLLSSPPIPFSPLSPLRFSFAFLRFLFTSADSFSSPDFRRRLYLSLRLLFFVFASSVSGFLSFLSVSGLVYPHRFFGFLGFGFGLVYGAFYIYMKRWVLEFPIIQRPPFYSFKMRLPLAIKQALRLSTVAYLFSAVLLAFCPNHLKSYTTLRKFLGEHIIIFCGSFSVFLCWEWSRHLHQVLHTKRFIFAPSKGSAAAETNPSEPLLAALEESTPGSLAQHLAYLDLCMVCENNVDTWRRAAFFEETGETYKRVASACLRPLEHLASTLAEGFSDQFANKVHQQNQLQPQNDLQLDSKYYEPLNNFQQCAWCARTVASLTARSHTEDRFGVAQLSGSNAAVVSTLLSCLLAVEALMGKKTSLPSPHQLTGAAGIKWATPNTARRDFAAVKKRGGPIYSKAYAMADVFRTSVYYIVYAFHDEMLASDKAGLLEKDWLISVKPLFGTHELLLQKLRLFLDFRAS